MIKIKTLFPTNEDEINLVKFIATYQYLSIKDVQFFFSGTYPPKRITRLVKIGILRRYKKYLVLGTLGIEFMNLLKYDTSTLIYQKKYAERIKSISHIAATFNKNKYISFTPSFKIKDKTIFTESSRKYIGIFVSRSIIQTMAHDLQKETKYKNIIILVDNISRINLKQFVFGFNSVLLCEDNDVSLKQLENMNIINWPKVIQDLYNEKIYLSEYNFCEYTDSKEKYINTFYLLDTEKINRIDIFIKNNSEKQAEVICNHDIVNTLRSDDSYCKL